MSERDNPDSGDKPGLAKTLFGRRKGPKLRKGQQQLIDELLPKLLLDPANRSPDDIADLFGGGTFDGVVMEIGFGGGEHLIHQAISRPDKAFIGVEPFVNGMAKALAAISKNKLTNIRLFDGDASELLEWLPDKSLCEVYLLYPDPWPKRRHWKRRFVNEHNLDEISRVLVPGGEFRFATDIDSYQNWTLQKMFNRSEFRWLAENADDWRNPWDGWIRTRYEAKAIRESRKPGYFRFRRN